MTEDVLVQMLLELGGGIVRDERDVELARAAGRWAAASGSWVLHLSNGFFFEIETLTFWIRANRREQVLEIQVKLAAGGWQIHARHQIAHLGHGLDVLAAEDLLPPRFSTLGRRALDAHAGVLWRYAKHLRVEHGESMTDWACGVAEAATSAESISGILPGMVTGCHASG
jgi:hypothetical protein